MHAQTIPAIRSSNAADARGEAGRLSEWNIMNLTLFYPGRDVNFRPAQVLGFEYSLQAVLQRHKSNESPMSYFAEDTE
jgi:hypothetical protein